jgi:predicted Zn-dependent peptidase
MLRIAQSMIYFNKVKPVEETIKKIRSVSAEEIREISNAIFNTTNKIDNGSLTRVILSPKNLLIQLVA